VGGGVQTGSTRHVGHLLAYCTCPGWLCEDGEFGGMNGRGNRSIRRKPAPAPLCPPQIPLDQTWDGTQAAAVGSQRLTASAMARPELAITVRLGVAHISKFRKDNYKHSLWTMYSYFTPFPHFLLGFFKGTGIYNPFFSGLILAIPLLWGQH
jgi:hypothetical protein